MKPLSSTKAQKCHRPEPLWDFTGHEHMPGGTGQHPAALWDLRGLDHPFRISYCLVALVCGEDRRRA